MVSAVGNSLSVLAPSQAQSQSQSSSSAPAVSFQQAVDQYMQDTTSGVGGTSSGTNPSQTLSSDLMSSLLQMQS
jgi:hypothetical protein